MKAYWQTLFAKAHVELYNSLSNTCIRSRVNFGFDFGDPVAQTLG